MTLNGTVSIVEKSNQLFGNDADAYSAELIAVGQNKVYLISEFRFISIDLKTGEVKTAGHSIGTKSVPVACGTSKSGYIDVKVLHTSGEPYGSRYLRVTDVRIDMETLEIVSSTTPIQLSGPALNHGLERPLVSPRTPLIYAGDYAVNKLVAVDLNSLTYWYTAQGGISGGIWADVILVDRTTHKPYIFWRQHYWATGSYTVCGKYDPSTDSMSHTTSYDCNAGAMARPKLYIGSDGKLRYIYTGTVCGYQLGARYSKYHLIYIDNGNISVESTPVGGSNYTSGGGANTPPFILGVTPDNTLALATVNRISWFTSNDSPAFNIAADLIECNDTLGSPTKIANATKQVEQNSNMVYLDLPFAFLLQEDWTYRIPFHVYPWSPSTEVGTMQIAKFSVSTELKPNPYGVIVVPP